MGNVRKLYQDAVETRGANAVARVTGLSRSSVLSVVAGTAREGTELLAEQRAPRLVPQEAAAEAPPVAPVKGQADVGATHDSNTTESEGKRVCAQ